MRRSKFEWLIGGMGQAIALGGAIVVLLFLAILVEGLLEVLLKVG
jgi:hypothetical protein